MFILLSDMPTSIHGHAIHSYQFYMDNGRCLETPDCFREFKDSLRVGVIAIDRVSEFLEYVKANGGDIERLDATPIFEQIPDYASAEELKDVLFAKGFCFARWREIKGSFRTIEMKTYLSFSQPVRLSNRTKEAKNLVRVSHLFVGTNGKLAYALTPRAHSGRTLDLEKLEAVSYSLR